MKNERYWLDIESGIIFDTENEKDFDPINKLNDQDQQISDLQKENEVLRKALELACEAHSENDKAYKIKSKQRSANKYFDYFIQQAKEQRDD